MSQQFINRKKELEILEEEYRKKEPSFFILYGRRRIGKSELILKFIKSKPSIYFLCSTEGDAENIKQFQTKAAEFLGDENFSKISFDSWYSLFSFLVKHKNFKTDKKVVIVFDEFPYLIISNPHIPSVFQKIWDEILSKENIMLILCGSYISIMERKVIAKNSPLYGRRTASLLLNSIDFVHLKEFLPRYNIEDLIKVWSFVGGVPAYLKKINQKYDFWHNVLVNIKKGSYLYEEAEILLRDEFREPRNYKLILKAISLGNTTLGKICNFTGLDKSMVSKYLEVLKEVKIVRELIPVTESKKFKRRLYNIADPYFNFWFRFVYPNKIDIEAHREKAVILNIKKEFQNYIAFMFELLIEELIRKRYIFQDKFFTKIGKQWGKIPKKKGNGVYEIDIVALNEQSKEILFCECKWQNKVNAKKICKELAEKAQYVQWHNEQRKESFAIFAKSFSKKITEFQGRKVYCFDLKALEKILNQKLKNIRI